MATPEQWKRMEGWSQEGITEPSCILELRERLAALEARQPAPPEPTQRTEPEVQREPLWVDMSIAWRRHHPEGIGLGSAEIDVVAAWLARYGHDVAALALRYEARRARGEA